MTRFLGVSIDCNLLWKTRVSNVIARIKHSFNNTEEIG